MTLKEELEILRGELIEVFTGNALDIPCIETSDAERLCRHPVVSVQMITYNHEAYIRQAIEGVMMQETDFEFELVIGEDCSQDKTREICFEYQRKYPDKIRVLWWYENVSKFGGNGRRTRAHCRGEFIALCEGDDYWTDPLKLQKQVQVMRKHPEIGFCFCGAKRYYMAEDRYDDWNEGNVTYRPGLQDKDWFFTTFLLGMGPYYRGKSYTGFIMTATTMYRASVWQQIVDRYDIFSWRMRLGDATLWLAISSMFDGYYLEDQVSVYRIADTGAFQNRQTRDGVIVDGWIIRLYFFKSVWNLGLHLFPKCLLWLLFSSVVARKESKGVENVRHFLQDFRKLPLKLVSFFSAWYLVPMRTRILLGLSFPLLRNLTQRFAGHFAFRQKWSEEVLARYAKLV